MEDSKKKLIMVVVIVVCLAAAAAITIRNTTGGRKGPDSLPADAMTWMICRNPDCEANYQMSLRDFFTAIEEYHKQHPMTMATPGLICEKCGEESLYRAEKCPKCDLVFETGSMGARDFADRRPKCGYSAMEAKRLESAKNK